MCVVRGSVWVSGALCMGVQVRVCACAHGRGCARVGVGVGVGGGWWVCVLGSCFVFIVFRVRGCGYFFVFFVVYFLSLDFITGIRVLFSLKSDIDVTVQPHLKMFGLCATTRVMCVRHLPHDWDTTAFAPVPCWAQLLFSEGWLYFQHASP